MQTARYHREQAELCLAMARRMSDRLAAEMLCMVAGRHFEQAIEVEKMQDHPPAAPIEGIRNVTNNRPDDFSDSFYYRAIRTKIGEALRSHLLPTEPSPKRLFDLLQKLDEPRVGDTGRTDEKPERLERRREV
jgi:hypothetical protein